MAKIGEGDSRWIVQERTDGRNVGDWHWTERNIFPMFKERIQALKGVKIPSGDNTAYKISAVEKVTGEMDVCNRRGKIIFIYDVTMKLKWRAVANINGERVSGRGTIEILDIDNSNEFIYKYTQEKQQANNKVFLNGIKKCAPSFFEKFLVDLIEQLRIEFTTVGESSMGTTPEVVPTATGDITESVVFGTSPDNIYQVLTNSQLLSALTDTHCNMELSPGSQFFLLDGGVSGSVVSFKENQNITLRWRFSDWTEDHYSLVSITLTPQSDRTLVELSQDRIPLPEITRSIEIWKGIFWTNISHIHGWPILE